MAFFGLFRKKQRPVIEDALFGTMTFFDARQPGDRYLECRTRFAGRPVEVTMEAGPDGPSEAQRAFFRSLEAGYDSLKAKLIPLLDEQLADWEAGPIRDFDRELELETITLPAVSDGPVQWSLCYVVRSIHHWATFELTDGTPDSLLIDG
ncbi:hypothetical protein GCM10023184_45990 [Flaviaesturariibacter amylovorans]|uniref:DUF2262 domain-containing protein n=2 Tax=Flaviaesturariibacter amylovorans TaxID=1084520 RepID=A0ABP8HU86_9BACT